MTTPLPPLSTLSTTPTSTRATILDTLFEPCTQLHTLSVSALSSTTFSSYSALIDAVGAQLNDLFTSDLQSDQKWLDAILSAHPRLGEKKVGMLSESSRREQEAMGKASAGADSEEVLERLRRLNGEYESVFPGLRYVVFVNGRARQVIMEDMQRRIARGDGRKEREDAIQAMCDIAKDRAKKMEAS